MLNTINIAQIAIAAFLVITILLQQRGSEAGGAFGGGGEVYYKKRGAEKILFIATIVLATLFIVLAFIRMVI